MKVRVVWNYGSKAETIECSAWCLKDNAIQFYSGSRLSLFCVIPLQNVLSCCQIKAEDKKEE